MQQSGRKLLPVFYIQWAQGLECGELLVLERETKWDRNRNRNRSRTEVNFSSSQPSKDSILAEEDIRGEINREKFHCVLSPMTIRQTCLDRPSSCADEDLNTILGKQLT